MSMAARQLIFLLTTALIALLVASIFELRQAPLAKPGLKLPLYVTPALGSSMAQSLLSVELSIPDNARLVYAVRAVEWHSSTHAVLSISDAERSLIVIQDGDVTLRHADGSLRAEICEGELTVGARNEPVTSSAESELEEYLRLADRALEALPVGPEGREEGKRRRLRRERERLEACGGRARGGSADLPLEKGSNAAASRAAGEEKSRGSASSIGIRRVPGRRLSDNIIDSTPDCNTFSACQSDCEAAYPATSGDYSSDWAGQSCDTICYDPSACPGSDASYEDGYNPAYCSRSETGTFSDCDSDEIPCGAFNLGVDYKTYGEGLCPDSITDSGCASTTLLRVGCDSDDCQGTPPFHDDGACLGPNKGCDECASDSDCVEMDGSKDTYGRHFFSSRSCDEDCDNDCYLYCTGGRRRRRHCANNNCNSWESASETNGRRRCGPTDANSKWDFPVEDSACEGSCDGAPCDHEGTYDGSCVNSEEDAETTRGYWNEAAGNLGNPTAAGLKDSAISIDDSEAFRGCHYSTTDVFYTDPNGDTTTQQKPQCDFEDFENGEYKNAWYGCDWGGCDEWI